MINTIYSFNTKKVSNTEYSFSILEITPRDTPNEKGSFADTEIVKSGVCNTPAKAMGLAKKWVIYYKRVGRNNG